jgi:D-amino peptidase
MKVYISVDIEGIAGITHWDEAEHDHKAYPQFQERMTGEAVAACEGAIAAGATEIWLKDAHYSGRNILAERLPECVRLIRGWSGHPLGMVQELDSSFDAAAFIGYHAAAGTEDLLYATAASTLGVPVVFVSGDEGLQAHVRQANPRIHTLATSRGVGPSTISVAPAKARADIKAGVAAALADDRKAMLLPLANRWTLEVAYSDPVRAYEASHYPGARLVADRTVRLEVDDYMDVLRALRFID